MNEKSVFKTNSFRYFLFSILLGISSFNNYREVNINSLIDKNLYITLDACMLSYPYLYNIILKYNYSVDINVLLIAGLYIFNFFYNFNFINIIINFLITLKIYLIFILFIRIKNKKYLFLYILSIDISFILFFLFDKFIHFNDKGKIIKLMVSLSLMIIYYYLIFKVNRSIENLHITDLEINKKTISELNNLYRTEHDKYFDIIFPVMFCYYALMTMKIIDHDNILIEKKIFFKILRIICLLFYYMYYNRNDEKIFKIQIYTFTIWTFILSTLTALKVFNILEIDIHIIKIMIFTIYVMIISKIVILSINHKKYNEIILMIILTFYLF